MAEDPDPTRSTDPVRHPRKDRTDDRAAERADDVAGHVQPPPDFEAKNTER